MTTLFDWQAERDIALETVERNAGEIFKERAMAFEQAIRLLQEVAGRHCSHIQKPYTLKEICEHVDGSEYNAELMLQHLLLWCSDYMKLP